MYLYPPNCHENVDEALSFCLFSHRPEEGILFVMEKACLHFFEYEKLDGIFSSYIWLENCYVRQCWLICAILLELSRGMVSCILLFILV